MKKYKITEEQIVAILKEFFNKNGDWPRAQEIPTLARMIQRRFGGLAPFREKHGLGYLDYTKGPYRSKITKEFNVRGHAKEDEVFKFLVRKYGRVNVHREYFFTDDSRSRADFFIFSEKGNVVVDCFYPKNISSLVGCLNLKISKYKKLNSYVSKCPVIFLQLNETISSESISDLAIVKKAHSIKNTFVMDMIQFKKFLDNRISLV